VPGPAVFRTGRLPSPLPFLLDGAQTVAAAARGIVGGRPKLSWPASYPRQPRDALAQLTKAAAKLGTNELMRSPGLAPFGLVDRIDTSNFSAPGPCLVCNARGHRARLSANPETCYEAGPGRHLNRGPPPLDLGRSLPNIDGFFPFLVPNRPVSLRSRGTGSPTMVSARSLGTHPPCAFYRTDAGPAPACKHGG